MISSAPPLSYYVLPDVDQKIKFITPARLLVRWVCSW